MKPFSPISSRGIWTWGHVIYDYRRFLQNMAALGLNKIVIWNDFAPLNARDIMEYAHTLGIRVVWGFAWGWINGCAKITSIEEPVLEELKEGVLNTFRTQYREICEDGIYFQSFTELGSDLIGGRLVAEAVTSFVNRTAAQLYREVPNLDIEFGLHATSVKNHLSLLAETDPRIRIVWEDCGAFPYAYEPTQTEGFGETVAFTEKLLTLRGPKEKCGIVVKGMTTLDWNTFENQKGPFILGESSSDFIAQRAAEKAPLWEARTEGWKQNASCLQTVLQLLSSSSADVVVEGLVEDGMLEAGIPYPAALYAALSSDPGMPLPRAEEWAKAKAGKQ